MGTVEQVKQLIAKFAGDVPNVDELARAIVALNDEATRATRVIGATELR
jgi:hypothetical protein